MPADVDTADTPSARFKIEFYGSAIYNCRIRFLRNNIFILDLSIKNIQVEYFRIVLYY